MNDLEVLVVTTCGGSTGDGTCADAAGATSAAGRGAAAAAVAGSSFSLVIEFVVRSANFALKASAACRAAVADARLASSAVAKFA
jgi:hypothetical protein